MCEQVVSLTFLHNGWVVTVKHKCQLGGNSVWSNKKMVVINT